MVSKIRYAIWINFVANCYASVIHFQSTEIYFFRWSATPQQALLQCHLQFTDTSKLRSCFESDILSDIVAVNFRNIQKIGQMGVSKIICFKAILNFISFRKLWWRRGLKYEGLTNLSFRASHKKNCFFLILIPRWVTSCQMPILRTRTWPSNFVVLIGIMVLNHFVPGSGPSFAPNRFIGLIRAVSCSRVIDRLIWSPDRI